MHVTVFDDAPAKTSRVVGGRQRTAIVLSIYSNIHQLNNRPPGVRPQHESTFRSKEHSA
jgi:hypothetical protein